MLRILFLSGSYSTPRASWLGMPNARILREMRQHATIKVVAPLPYYPRQLPLPERVRPMAELPLSDTDHDGSELLHPRRLHLPVVHALQAPLYIASVAPVLRRVVREFRPNVVLSAWAYPDGTAAVALAKLFGLPCVVRAMGSDINDFAQRPLRRVQIQWALRRAARVIAVSRPLGAEIRKLGVPAHLVSVVPTGVDTSKFSPVDREEALRETGLPSGHRIVLVPSRLSREKGIRYFLDALTRIPAGTHGVLVGSGDEERALRAQAEALGITSRVTFAGYQEEPRMRYYYSAADVTCLPSTEEGWPNVLMESMACGCPVVASDVGGVSDLISLTRAGTAVPPAKPAELASALMASLQREWDRPALSRQMAKHTIQVTGKRYYETCEEVAR